ncbi:methyl-accepting chemotaxis protein [Yersinia pekkanenii]|uniref:Methyl-accepting chemotaxis protein n=1 Tax=Yersinia pekkanenii TaxID=1288385 RepID=A0A0T9P525_9GAMM|nr:methyl-accepting chemotaxis protein [Yersinia pekkanenii]CNH45856.1 putative methyl-accepting chemotaxis protein [Yersinia pekkanenii]CRY67630.1 putative methyl-accepting chemotaxis protein [Yersinia pekkanenii]
MNFLKHITIRMALLSILVVFLLLWGGVSAFTLFSLNQLTYSLQVSSNQQKSVNIVNQGNDQYFRVVTRLIRAAAYRQNGVTAEADRELASAGVALKNTQEALAKFKLQTHEAVEPSLTDKTIQSWSILLSKGIDPMFKAVSENRYEDFQRSFNNDYPPLSREFGAAVEKYNSAVDKVTEAASLRVTSLVTWCQRALLAALIAGIIILFLTDCYLVNFLVRPLNLIKAHFKRLAEGQLGQPMAEFSRNCIGQLIPYLREMQNSLVNTVSTIRNSTDAIYTGAGEIAAGNADLSSRTEQQAAALEETAASMEQLNATVKQNAENAHQASKLAENASEIAQNGGRIINDVVATMSNITESSRRIADIIGVINSIAFQTNILALNAAVEAARAGEQGRGFAVVASEVRNLAARSAQAAKEIEGLISESVSRVNIGSRQVSEAGETMNSIVQAVTNVTDIMGEIAAASDEQSRGISQIGQAVAEMDGVTQQNASLVQEAAAAAASLEEQARQLAKAVSVFNLSDNMQTVNY